MLFRSDRTWPVRNHCLQVDRPAGSDYELAMSCLRTLLAGWDRCHLDDENVTARTVLVDSGSMSATDFGITKAEQSQLFESGRSAATSFLAGLQPATLAQSIRG